MIKHTTPIIVGNWKATPGTLKEAQTFIKNLDKKCLTSKIKLPKKAYYLAVPDVFITTLSASAQVGYIGAENVSGTTLGQLTGTITPLQLISGGASFTIIGHSEVRSRGETVEERAKKTALSLQSKLTTILCFGEKNRDKDGKYLAELEHDVRESLALTAREYFNGLIIAYEPVWAIGGQVPATAQECFEAVIALRRALSSIAGIDHAKKVKILYGGTVSKDNAKQFLEDGGVDGLLVGRASQEVTSFIDILTACHSA
jgi:triosephosphate isomerase (TIM)